MPVTSSRPARLSWWVFVFVPFAVIAGCAPAEDIRTYTVPKAAEPTPNPPEAKAETAAGEFRILGAMFPADNPVWFFKITGPGAAIGEHEAAFDRFLATLRFPADPKQTPTWELPPGWRSGGPESIHADTLLFGPPARPLKLTVTPAMGGLGSNVQRWVSQVGATAGPDDLAKYTRTVETAAGVKGIRVDVSGPNNPVGGPMMMGR